MLAFAACFLILVGTGILTMGYFFNHPTSIFNAFDSFTSKLTEGEAYEETEEYFLQGIKSADIAAESTSIEVIPYDGTLLKISISGKVPHFEKGPFLVQSGDPDHLTVEIHEPVASTWVHVNINGHNSELSSDTSLNAKIYLPKNFMRDFTVTTNQGHVKVSAPKNKIYEFDLESNSGEIKNLIATDNTKILNPNEVGKMRIITNSGSILIE